MRQALAILLCASQCWGALTFSAASTNKVNCGSNAVLDNVTAGTMMVWYRPAAVNTYRAITSKADTAYTAFHILSSNSSGNVRWQIKRATTSLNVASANSAIAINTWYFLAATWDTAGAAPAVYRGTLSATVADISSGSPTAGTGAVADDSGNSFLIGNDEPAASLSANGRIAFTHMTNYRMTLAELVAQQFRPRVVAGTVFFAHFSQTANFTDLSGNQNACVVTGATVSDHVPIGPWFGLFDIRKFLRIPTHEDPNTHDLIFAD